jgi:ATP-dependent Zn protease
MLMIMFRKIFIISILVLNSFVFVDFRSSAGIEPEIEKLFQYEQWRYSQFIQEVESGKVEKVNIYQDLSTAIVTRKHDSKQKRVTLVNDPELVNILIRKNIEINVLPKQTQYTYDGASTWSYSQLQQEIKRGHVKQGMMTSDGYTVFVFYKSDPKLKLVHLINNDEIINNLVRQVDIRVLPVGKKTDILSISYADSRDENPESQQWSYSKLIQQIEKNNIASVTVKHDFSQLRAISKNDKNVKVVNLLQNPKLLETLVKNNVSITVLPEKIQEQDKKLETLQYSVFIQEASKGNIQQLNVYQDRRAGIVLLKNDTKKKLVYLYPQLITKLVQDGVDVGAIPGQVHEKGKQLEQWRYTKFIQKVKRGAVKRVSLSADRTAAIVTLNNDAKKKLVYLVDDPELINMLVNKNVDISVLPE